jgi:starvation-inducible DNA-binding protein
MSVNTDPTHAPDVAESETGSLLQATLVELIALSLIGKQLHWNITGSGFRELHLQLDEFVASCRDLLDTAAERQAAIGLAPDGRAESVAGSEVESVQAGAVPTIQASRLVAARIADVIQRTHSRLDLAGELDLVSQDILIDVTRRLEHHLWMFRAA